MTKKTFSSSEEIADAAAGLSSPAQKLEQDVQGFFEEEYLQNRV